MCLGLSYFFYPEYYCFLFLLLRFCQRRQNGQRCYSRYHHKRFLHGKYLLRLLLNGAIGKMLFFISSLRSPFHYPTSLFSFSPVPLVVFEAVESVSGTMPKLFSYAASVSVADIL